MFDLALQAQLKTHFQKLTRPVELKASLGNDTTSLELKAWLEALLPLSSQFQLSYDHLHVRTPSFALSSPGQEIHVRFSGIPNGHEFTSLVLAILQVGGVLPKLTPETIEHIQNLEGDYQFETFVSLTCQNCPEVIQALNAMAVLNPRIRTEMVDGGVFQTEATDRNILAVPAIFLNGEEFGQGRMSVEDIVAKLDKNVETHRTEQLNQKDIFDMLVVGGGPAGASSAIYAARKGIKTGLVADRFGGQVLDTIGIENFISVQETEGPKLAASLEAHVRSYPVDLILRQQAKKLHPKDHYVEVELESGAHLKAKTLVIATGARWRSMNVPGEQEYRTKGVTYCPHCDGPFFKGKKVAVIGGGNSGVEAAIDLAGIVDHVTLLEFDNKLRADAVLQNKLYSLSNVTVLTSALTTEVLGDGEKVMGLRYKNRITDEEVVLSLSGIFVQIGLLPNTHWLKETVALNGRGEIEIDDKGQTSMPGVFAAGDATTVPFKQIMISMGEGVKAALGAFEYLIRET